MAKILIIEDDPLISRLYQKAFSFEQYEVEVASDGVEGLGKVRTTRPNLVLLDVMMPKMNGIEVLEKIKQDPDLRKTPVIILTNLSGQQDAETALTKGAIKYIVKSEYDPQDIVKMVKDILTAYTRDEIPTV